MIEAYSVLAERIHQELDELALVVDRAKRAAEAAQEYSEEQDLFVDAAALNLHDF